MGHPSKFSIGLQRVDKKKLISRCRTQIKGPEVLIINAFGFFIIKFEQQITQQEVKLHNKKGSNPPG